MRKKSEPYSSSLSDKEWKILEPLLPARSHLGRPPTYPLRDIVNGILYVLVEGIRWRSMPKDLPPWDSVYGYFRLWRNNGVLENMHQALYVKERERQGRHSSPSAGCIDSQSVKGHNKGIRGFDGGKQVKGRKRHMLVDTLGLLMAILVTTANINDKTGAKKLLSKLKGRFPRFKTLFADGAYQHQFPDWLNSTLGWLTDIVINLAKGFNVIPKRWVVERSFAWLGQCRRLSKDYEDLPASSEAFIFLAMSRIMLKRLAKELP